MSGSSALVDHLFIARTARLTAKGQDETEKVLVASSEIKIGTVVKEPEKLFVEIDYKKGIKAKIRIIFPLVPATYKGNLGKFSASFFRQPQRYESASESSLNGV